jgi:hypothetical protein
MYDLKARCIVFTSRSIFLVARWTSISLWIVGAQRFKFVLISLTARWQLWMFGALQKSLSISLIVRWMRWTRWAFVSRFAISASSLSLAEVCGDSCLSDASLIKTIPEAS